MIEDVKDAVKHQAKRTVEEASWIKKRAMIKRELGRYYLFWRKFV